MDAQHTTKESAVLWKHITIDHVIWAIFLFAMIVSPGVLVLLKFKPAFFTSLDNWRLLIVSGSLSVPLIGWTFFWLLELPLPNGGTFSAHDSFYSAAGLTAFIIYLSLGITYLWALDFRVFLKTILWIEALFWVWFLLIRLNAKFKKTA